MVRQTLKILQQMLQDFKSVSDHFGTLCMNGLKQERLFYYSQLYYNQRLLVQEQQRQPQKNM